MSIHLGGGGSTNWFDPLGVTGKDNPTVPSVTYHFSDHDEPPDGGGASQPSQPSLQDNLLQQQLDETEFNKLLRPYLLQNMGLEEIDDPNNPGKKILQQMSEEKKYSLMTPEQKSAYDLDKLATAQQLKYAQGQGEVPEAVTQKLAEQRQNQDALLHQRLGGKGSLLSTSGIDTASNATALEEGVKSAYNYGNETQGLGLLGMNAQNLANQTSMWNQNANSLLTSGTGLPGMYATAQRPYVAQQGLYNLQDSLQQQKEGAVQGGLLQGIGTIGSFGSKYLTKGMGGK